MKSSEEKKPPSIQWLDLSDAAQFLDVHFTTLRRWADTGKINYIRTPGGRRRFSMADLEQFRSSLRQAEVTPYPAKFPREQPNDIVHRQIATEISQQEYWLYRFTDVQRLKFKYTGQMLFGLLMQYNSRTEGEEVFLQEAERIARDYGSVCFQSGMSITETAQAFIFFRRSIMGMVSKTNAVFRQRDEAGQRLLSKTLDFMDTLLLATIEGYSKQNDNLLSEG
ncbi:MAG: helix-turn-helix domain-containing protein [Chloroflexota bacterium]|jgi:excisionase family DNA binding protein